MQTPTAAAVPWNQRTSALVKVAADLGAREAGGPRRRSLHSGLCCLAKFADKQLQLFGGGFEQGRLELDPAFPPQFLLEATMRQVSYDIDVLTRAAAQRDENNSTRAMRATLELADKLAAAALAPAVREKLMENSAIVTYYQKSPMIRLLPYAPLALIGVDLASIEDAARLLAIGHEAGHYVYRQQTTNYTANVDQQIMGRDSAPEQDKHPAWLRAWEEEVFADIYAALVAGPAAGYSVQAMLMGEMRAAMTFDDGDHPLAALRPEIAVAVINALASRTKDGQAAQRLKNAAQALQQHWQQYLAGLKIEDSFVAARGKETVTLAEGRKQLQAYVEEMLAGPLVKLTDAGVHRWSTGLDRADAALLPELYKQFTQFTTGAGQLPASVPELVLHDNGTRAVVTPQVAGGPGGQRIVGEIGDANLDKLRDGALQGKQKLSRDEWGQVFLAGDWVTEEGGSGITPVR